MEQDLQFEQRKADIWVKARQEVHKAFVYYGARRDFLRSLKFELVYLRDLKRGIKKALDSGDFGLDLNARIKELLKTFEGRMDLSESIDRKLTREEAILACEKSLGGVRVTLEKALEGLGDPATWDEEAKALYAEFEKKPS